MGADQILQRGERHKQTRTLAMFDDGHHVPVVIQEIVGVADFQFLGFGGPVIHEQVVRAFHVVTLQENKSSGHSPKTFRIDAVNHFDAAGGVELQKRGSDGLHVFHLRELVANLDGHGRAAEAQENGGGRRLQHDVRANPFDTFCGFGKQAGGEANDQHHKGNFDSHGHDADHGSQGAVQQIADDEFAHHRGFSSVFSPTRTSSVPSGCSSLKRSGGRSSFSVTFVIWRSRR